MGKVLVGLICGALITIFTLGHFAEVHKVHGLDWITRWWVLMPKQRLERPATSWTSQPKLANGAVEVTAWGAASREDSDSQAHAVALALRTARHLAYERLAEYLKGARTTGSSHYHVDLLERGELTTSTAAIVRWAKVVGEEVKELPDGSVRAVVTIRYPLGTGRKAKV